jgi:hypothetical protein
VYVHRGGKANLSDAGQFLATREQSACSFGHVSSGTHKPRQRATTLRKPGASNVNRVVSDFSGFVCDGAALHLPLVVQYLHLLKWQQSIKLHVESLQCSELVGQ